MKLSAASYVHLAENAGGDETQAGGAGADQGEVLSESWMREICLSSSMSGV
jgi:hypothetical protein